MEAKLVDLGKRLEIDLEPGCYVSAQTPTKVWITGDVYKIERTLELALIAVRRGRAG